MHYVQIQTTHDDRDRLIELIQSLLVDRLIACGKVLGPIVSQYWWEGKIETAQEWLALCNTTEELSQRTIEAIRDKHPYDVPEIVVTELPDGLLAYMEWMGEVTKST